MKFRHFASFALLLMSLAACHKGHDSSEDRALTDSLLHQTADILFTDPRKADSLYADKQRQVTDSSAYYRLALYRATAAQRLGDTLALGEAGDRVLRWAAANDSDLAGQVWNHRAVGEILYGRPDSAYACLTKAFDYMNCSRKTKSLLPVCINLADMAQKKGDIPKSAYYYHYTLLLADSLNVPNIHGAVYAGLAQTYLELGNFREVRRFLDLAEHYIDQEPIQTRLFYYMTRGNCMYYEHRYEEARRSFDVSYELASGFNDDLLLLQVESNLTEVCLAENRLAEARTYADRALGRLKKMAFVDPGIRFYMESLNEDLKMAEHPAMLETPAIEPANEAIKFCPPRYISLHYRRLAEHFANHGRWEKAYRYGRLAESYADSVRNRQMVSSVIEMEQRYERDTTYLSQRFLIADYQKKATQQRFTIVVGLLSVAVIALVFLFAFLWWQRRAETRFKQQREVVAHLRMGIVRNRLSPHYISNVLGTLVPKIRQYPELADTTDLLIDVLRGNLMASAQECVALEDEIALVQDYVQLHEYTHNPSPTVVWKIDESIDRSRPVPSMCLEIPVENALKHAFPQPSAGDTIEICIGEEDGAIVISVADNGCGCGAAGVKRTGRDTGSGLRMLGAIIALMNEKNRQPASFELVNAAGGQSGTTVRFRFPKGYSLEAQLPPPVLSE